MYNSQGNASEREELHSEFCSVFFVDFFPGVRECGGPRFVAGLVLRVGFVMLSGTARECVCVRRPARTSRDPV